METVESYLTYHLLNESIDVYPRRIEETNSIVLAVRKGFWTQQQRQFSATENDALNAGSLPQLGGNSEHLLAGLGQKDVVQ